MDAFQVLTVPGAILSNIDGIWTFLLLLTRFTGFFTLVPGIGMGERGLVVRLPAVTVLAAVSMYTSPHAEMPVNWIMAAIMVGSEYMLGMVIGMIPMMIIAGVQNAIQLASTSMGLGMGNLMDPTLGIQTSDVARIMGDICTITFLLMGGHHVVVHATAGLGGVLVPGTFSPSEITLSYLIDGASAIMKYGAILASPVIVALMLTNFVMGLVTKAVPTVNIFIVSFPLTIGIGLILTALAIPDISVEFKEQVMGIEGTVLQILQDAKTVALTP